MLQLVDNQGQTIGLVEKIPAHEEGGVLHRAVSVVLLDCDGRILIQRRAAAKYHFAGKWANASCTHPHFEETPEDAGKRALRQELGIETELQEVTRFIYLAHDPASGYTEQEYDHVLLGFWSHDVHPNPDEVSEVDRLTPQEVHARITSSPGDFAYWFPQILREVQQLEPKRLESFPELAQFIQGMSPLESSPLA